MSSQDVSINFKKFGIIMISIAILTILSFILALITFVSNFGIRYYIGTTLTYMALIFRITALIIIFIALGEIKKASDKFNDPDLLRFRHKFIIFVILRLIGYLLFIVYIAPIVFSTVAGFHILFSFIAIITAIILLITSAIFEIQAWNIFKCFFTDRIQLFPANIGKNSKLGSNLCKIASIFESTLILWFIGDILRIIGYFLLSFLKNLSEGDVIATPRTRPQQMQPLQIPIPTSAAGKKFCANCGAPLRGAEKFCTSCGSKI